ncbi:MAG: phosphatase PAP2 family protein [Erysipelotrichaceae bacterium]|nr:phosphatase PAP2 family protein [Erysipelotrichaceae bacterium]
MGTVFQFEWEVKLIVAVQNLIRSFPFLKSFFSFFTTLGEAATLVVLIGFIYWCLNKNLGIKIAVYLLSAMAFNCMLKNVFRRIRPYAANDSIECFKVPEAQYDMNDMAKQGFSFPSGHATSSSRFLTTLYLDGGNNRLLYFGSLIVSLICISRFALGVHYPTDVLTGVFLGIVPALIIDRLSQKLEKKHLYILLLLFSCLGIFFCTSNDYYSIIGLMAGFLSGDLFDERYVRFENTRNVWRMIIRTLFGGILFLGITTVLKKPFPEEVLEAHTAFAYLYRIFRYSISSFIIIGLYPMLFKYNILKFEEKDAG